MTVTSDRTSREIYDGNDVTTTFAIPFPFNDDSDLVKVILVDAGLVENPWTENSQYTVVGNDVIAGALYVPATGESLVIYRETPRLQSTDFIHNRSYEASVLEEALDKQTFMAQEREEEVGRSAKLPITTPTDVDPELPTPSADMLLGWDSTAKSLENKASLAAYSVTAFAETLLDDADRDEARATLGMGLTAADVAAMIVLQATGGYVDGELVTTLDYGNIYTWDDGNSKWIVHSGNLYATADLPTTTDFTIPTGTLVRDITTGNYNYWSGAAWLNYYASASVAGAIVLATAAENKTGTEVEKAITPAIQQNHLSACKAWAAFAGDGTVASSYNCTVTQDGTGVYTITFVTAMADANYAVICSSESDDSLGYVTHVVTGGTKTAAAVQIETVTAAGAAHDMNEVYVAIFGN